MKTFISSEILDRLREALHLPNDTELATCLGIKKATLSNWRSRNSLDWPLLFSFCEHINLDWLVMGRGTHDINTAQNKQKQPNSDSNIVEFLNNKLKEKDIEIGDLRQKIGKLEAKLEMLEVESNPSVAPRYAPYSKEKVAEP